MTKGLIYAAELAESTAERYDADFRVPGDHEDPAEVLRTLAATLRRIEADDTAGAKLAELLPLTRWAPAFFPEGDAQPDAEGLVWLYDAEGEKLLKVDPRRWQVVAAALELAHEAAQTVGGALWSAGETTENLQQLEVRSMTYPKRGGR